MRFTFIHAADLHIDSPFAGLGLKDTAVAERFFKAGRTAVEALVAEAIDSRAAFLIIAGDVFDGDWRDVPTGHFFVRMLGKLHRAGIPTILVKGNHDADSVMSRSLRHPETVWTFPSHKSDTFVFAEHRVAVHGRSFGSRKVADDFISSYPARHEGWLNIGVLHTALDGRPGHDSYAPCTIEDLRRFGYDYWALGHIHAAETVSKDPWIVYPGNLQGRSVRELGPKGAMRVTVEDGHIVEVTPLILDAARWAHEMLDVSACTDEASVLEVIRRRLSDLHPTTEGRPLAVRITLTGTTPAHALLAARRETIEEEVRALGFQFAEDCWVEQVKLKTVAPARPAAATSEPDALDVAALLAAAAEDPDFAGALAELTASVAEKLPRELRSEFASDDPAELARRVASARDYLTGLLAP